MRYARLLALPTLLAGFACQDAQLVEPDIDAVAEMSRVDGAVSLPFKADLSVWDRSDYTDLRCGGFPNLYLTMEGSGHATHLGRLTTRMTFCCNVQTGAYGPTDIVFRAASGDELHATIPTGQIVPNDGDNSDYYQTRFDDLGVFTGGTGQFEGASGTFHTNAWVHNGADEWRTDFFSEGILQLVRGTRRLGVPHAAPARERATLRAHVHH